jgi:hypothetical protein
LEHYFLQFWKISIRVFLAHTFAFPNNGNFIPIQKNIQAGGIFTNPLCNLGNICGIFNLWNLAIKQVTLSIKKQAEETFVYIPLLFSILNN